MKRIDQLYLIIISLIGFGIFFVLHVGNHLPPPDPRRANESVEQPAPHIAAAVDLSTFVSVKSSLWQNANSPLSRLFLQLAVIICAAYLVGWAFTRFGQPAVVGEMMAGILLGPSLFGFLAPRTFEFVFSASSLDALRLFSQLGVCLFMFAVGMEVDVSYLRNKARTAVLISNASIIIPYFFGVLLALLLYRRFAQPGASFTAFALFMGISMSITAFPVLVRILQDRGIFKTSVGSTATACAAMGDVTAWIVLAFVVAIARATSISAAAFSLGLVLIYGAIMLLAVRPNLARWLGRSAVEAPEPGKGILAEVIGVVLISALITELIGIHALFGAFLAGIVMPARGGFREKLGVRVESLSSVLLLPVFFAFIGLRTQVGLLNDARDWIICFVIIGVATLGKLGGTALTARLTGMEWRESLQLGALMNTRGLMELIALNIGYELGILSLRIFTMLVIMALFTTVLTGPLLTLFGKKRRHAEDPPVSRYR